MPRRRKKSPTETKTLLPPVQEQLLIDAVMPLLADGKPIERVLCTTLGRGQLAAAIAGGHPETRVTCHFLDAYLANLTSEFQPQPMGFDVVCTAEIPTDAVDLVAFPTHSGGEAELTRDYLQCGHQALVDGGRMAVSTNNDQDSWLHEQMQAMFDKVTRIATKKKGTVFIGRKTEPLKKLKSFECRFTFPDRDRLITAVSRPGVFSHRRLDGGARALLRVAEVRDGDRIIDMGCGAGTVSLALAARNETVTIAAVDSNARAIWCTEQGAELNDLRNVRTVHTADGTVPEGGSYDLLVGNPPYFSNYRIAELFLQTALKALKPGGEVMIVTKNVSWYKTRMAELFDDVGIAQAGHYQVIGGVNPRRRRPRRK